MLRDIDALWPPEPGIKTGIKMKFPDGMTLETGETLSGLGTHHWWAGVKIIVPPDEKNATFSVRLITAEGEPVFGFGRLQAGNVWTPFPWPIPANMATSMALCLDVKRIDSDTPLMIGINTCFYDLAEMPHSECYLFMNRDGSFAYHWDGVAQMWGAPHRGNAPKWRVIHTVIPRFEMLGSWDRNHNFCIHNWNERFPINPRELYT